MNEKYVQVLRELVQKRYGCPTRYAQTVAVKEEVNGQTVWAGNIEIFDLAGHAQARQCFAWGQKDAEGRMQYVTSLKVPPVDTARHAVQAYLASQKNS